MRIKAATIGPGVDNHHFDGTVHSVFERVCNIRLTGGGLISLVRSDVFNGPGTIRCETPSPFSFLEQLREGAAVTGRAGIVRISGSPLSIDLRPATAWRRRPEDMSNKEHLRDHWPDLWQAAAQQTPLQQLQLPSGQLSLIMKAGIPGNHIPALLGPLVGRGPGLTPAGDDVIVGFAAAQAAHHRLDGDFATWLKSSAARTTALSGWALLAAADGWFSEPILDYLQENSGQPRLLGIGDTSGPAMAIGILAGVAQVTGCRDALAEAA